MKNINIAVSTLLISQILYAGGYKIPESSLKATALSAGYVANSHGADASYYNPANLVDNDDIEQIDMGITYIGLPKSKFTSTVSPALNGESKKENFLVPNIHYSSKEIDGFRYGFSIVSPAGLSKRWDSAYQKASANEFTLQVIELNPTIAKKVNEKVSIGIGLRILHSSGVVKSDSTAMKNMGLAPASIARDMSGDSIDYGYNLAINYMVSSQIKLSSTYRSKVDLNLDGDAKLYLNGTKVYDGGSSVSVPVPSSFVVALAFKQDKTTYEIVYDKTFWSDYKTLDFEYSSSIHSALKSSFDDPITKDWKDRVTYRLGITHLYYDKVDLMFG
jgi:long-chain fatty acid transport protein